MAIRIKIKTPDDSNVHFDTFINNYTLCGLETGGDGGLRFEKAVNVKSKVNCPHCIRIVEFCQSIKKTEFVGTAPSPVK